MPTTNYIWDEQNYLAETDENNVVQTVYTNEPAQYGNLISSRIAGTTSYHHFDALGSTRQLMNAGGTVTDIVIYDAWGNVVSRTGATGTARLWVGVLTYYSDPETSQIWVLVRPYGPGIARWTTPDPLNFGAYAGRVVSRFDAWFEYSRNSPLNRTDPAGLRSIPFGFDAFIPGRLGSWLPEPPPWSDWEYETDRRTFGGGSSRVFSRGSIESTEIGYVCSAGFVSHGSSGSTRRRKVGGVVGGYQFEQQFGGIRWETVVRSSAMKPAVCTTSVKLQASGSYPFVEVAPDIDYRAIFTFMVIARDQIKVTMSGQHDQFPNYEATLDGRGASPYAAGGAAYEYDTPGSGPGIWNLAIGDQVHFGPLTRYIGAPTVCCPNPGKSCSDRKRGYTAASVVTEWTEWPELPGWPAPPVVA